MIKLDKAGRAIMLGVLLLSCAGCASIPSAAPELSTELGQRIDAIQTSNLTLLHRFFELKKADVDRFIQDAWVSTLSNEVFKDPKTQEIWKAVVAENKIEEQLKFATMIGTKMQERINQKRTELIMPLDEIEKRIEQEIRNEYAQARAINNSITSFLLSAAKVAENRDRYLALVGVKSENVDGAIDTVNDAVNGLLAAANTADATTNKAKEYLDKLRKIKELFLNKKEN